MQVATSKFDWFREARFGMFVHWGLYSLLGRGEWVMYQENMPVAEYEKLADRFVPKRYRPKEWVALAQEAGMKYMVFTTKHHDGFCLFDSSVSNFTSAKTIGRDFVAEFVDACRKADMRIGFYYSLPDWRRPVFFEEPKKDHDRWLDYVAYLHAQVEELCTQYGKIDILWYDRMTPRNNLPYTAEDWQAEKLNAMVRRHQPQVLINDRSELPEDFDTPEQNIKSSESGRLWEACMTMNRHWGFCPDDDLWKSPRELIMYLTGCAGTGGNYLLNVAPDADGVIPAESERCLRDIGKWLKVNGEAVYGVESSPIDPGTAGVVTTKGTDHYLVVHWWPGQELTLPSVKIAVKSAFILSTGAPVKLEWKGERLILKDLPSESPDSLGTVIVLKT